MDYHPKFDEDYLQGLIRKATPKRKDVNADEWLTNIRDMFSVIESCNMNKLSPGWYIKELVSRLTAKASSSVYKVALLPCFIQK